MRMDHIPTLWALFLEDPLRFAAINLICKHYAPQDISYIWSQWEPHIQLPLSHPLAEADLSRDRILAMLQATYTAPEPTARDTQTLTDLVSVAIPVKICILFTAITLREEEMVTHTPSHRHPTSWRLALLSLTYVVFDAAFALPGHVA